MGSVQWGGAESREGLGGVGASTDSALPRVDGNRKELEAPGPIGGRGELLCGARGGGVAVDPGLERPFSSRAGFFGERLTERDPFTVRGRKRPGAGQVLLGPARPRARSVPPASNTPARLRAGQGEKAGGVGPFT